MKLRIEIDGNLEETEIVIKTPTLTDEIADLQRLLQESKAPRLTFYKGTGEYYLDLSEILFFETEGSKIYAHNQKEAYEVRLKLYELESILPRYFNRVSKSTIANIRQILLSGQVLFRNGHHFLLSDAQGGSCLTALPIPPKRKSKKHEVKNMKKKAFGIVLLVLAALILVQGNFGIPSLGGHIWPLIGIAFFAYQSVGALLRRHLTSASFTALVSLMIANHFYGILPIPNQTLIWAGVLIVLGVNMLTHSNRTWNGKKWWYDGEKNILIDKEVAFGTGTFYKQDQELVEDQVEVGFGNAKIYYDNAEMLGDFATLNIEVAFGNATVYVPQHWRVDLKVETSFGTAKADAPVAPTSKTLIIRGDVAFGKLELVYVK